MGDLIAFLRARLDEDEQVACEAIEEHASSTWFYEYNGCIAEGDGDARSGLTELSRRGDMVGPHIERHDPARVLAEVGAKRTLIDRVVKQIQEDEELIEGEWGAANNPDHVNASTRVLRALAAIHADHPDYREEWKP